MRSAYNEGMHALACVATPASCAEGWLAQRVPGVHAYEPGAGACSLVLASLQQRDVLGRDGLKADGACAGGWGGVRTCAGFTRSLTTSTRWTHDLVAPHQAHHPRCRAPWSTLGSTRPTHRPCRPSRPPLALRSRGPPLQTRQLRSWAGGGLVETTQDSCPHTTSTGLTLLPLTAPRSCALILPGLQASTLRSWSSTQCFNPPLLCTTEARTHTRALLPPTLAGAQLLMNDPCPPPPCSSARQTCRGLGATDTGDRGSVNLVLKASASSCPPATPGRPPGGALYRCVRASDVVVCVRVRACIRACVRACVRARVCVCVCVCVCVHACVCARTGEHTCGEEGDTCGFGGRALVCGALRPYHMSGWAAPELRPRPPPPPHPPAAALLPPRCAPRPLVPPPCCRCCCCCCACAMVGVCMGERPCGCGALEGLSAKRGISAWRTTSRTCAWGLGRCGRFTGSSLGPYVGWLVAVGAGRLLGQQAAGAAGAGAQHVRQLDRGTAVHWLALFLGATAPSGRRALAQHGVQPARRVAHSTPRTHRVDPHEPLPQALPQRQQSDQGHGQQRRGAQRAAKQDGIQQG